MNLQLDNLPNCITSLRAEIPAAEVTTVWDNVVGEYARQVKLPGYRPGKAPKGIVEARFKKEIREEVQSRLVGQAVRKAIDEHKLRYLTVQNVDDVEFGDDKSLSFTATIITAPSFELPEYKGIAVTIPPQEVTDEEVQAGLDRLREQGATFEDLTDRAVELEDYAVITYQGTIDGKPVSEAVPAAGRMISGNNDFWIKLTQEAFFPGFSEKLAGTKIGETREFDIEVPADFPVADLAGKTIHYSVTLNAIKKKVLPELNDDFAAKVIPGKTLEELKEIARNELSRQKEFDAEQEKRNQIVKYLIDKVECELPEGHVQAETHRVLTDIIQQNQARGVSEETIKANQKELLATATETARSRVKAAFILARIAEEEKIRVSREEFEQSINLMAARYGTTADKLKKDIERAGSFDRLHEEILTGKVLDFLVANATVSTKAAEAPAEAAEAKQA